MEGEVIRGHWLDARCREVVPADSPAACHYVEEPPAGYAEPWSCQWLRGQWVIYDRNDALLFALPGDVIHERIALRIVECVNACQVAAGRRGLRLVEDEQPATLSIGPATIEITAFAHVPESRGGPSTEIQWEEVP